MLKFICILVLGIVFSYADAMKSDSAHKKKEEYISSLTYAQMIKMSHGEAIRWLITPKLRLTKEEISDLQKGALVQAEGARTIATLTAIEWNGDLTVLADGSDLLMEKVMYDPEKIAYIVTYRYPKDNKNKDKGVKVQISDIKIKDSTESIGVFLIDLISHPGLPVKAVAPQAVQIIPSSTPQAAVAQSPVIVQTSPQPQVVIVEQAARPYYGPYYYPGVVIGGYRHHRHW